MNFENSTDTVEKHSAVQEYLPKETVEELRAYITHVHSGNFSLQSLFMSSETYDAFKKMKEHKVALGLPTDEIPHSVRESFAALYQKFRDVGFDGDASGLLVRWVATKDPTAVSAIMEQSQENGGKIDNKSGLNMSPLGSKADDVFARGLSQGDHGVLFVYDGRKLQPLSSKEAQSDIMFAGGYGYKTKDDASYSSALIGAIGFS